MPDSVCPCCGSVVVERGPSASEYSDTAVLVRACTGCAYREERAA